MLCVIQRKAIRAGILSADGDKVKAGTVVLVDPRGLYYERNGYAVIHCWDNSWSEIERKETKNETSKH